MKRKINRNSLSLAQQREIDKNRKLADSLKLRGRAAVDAMLTGADLYVLDLSGFWQKAGSASRRVAEQQLRDFAASGEDGSRALWIYGATAAR